MYSMVAPERTVHFYLFCTITRASVSVHVGISAEYLYSSEHALPLYREGSGAYDVYLLL